MPRKPVRQEQKTGLRVAVYIRVSSQRQATEGDSLEAQQNEITKYIELKQRLHGWNVLSVGHYVDAGKSAKDQNRPQLQRLKRDIVEGRIDMVVTFKLDRLTRSLLDFVELWDLFAQHEVNVVCLREDFDTSTPMGKAMIRLIMVFAEFEREVTAERTIAIMQDRVERGLWNGGHVYGYRSDPNDKGKLLIDPEWAEIIRRHFFDSFEELGSAGAVQRRLQQLGILMPTRKSRAGKTRGGKPFSKQQVIGILRNPIYIGRIQWGKAYRDGCHEAIIDPQQFERVQRKLDETTRRRRNHRYTRGRAYLLRSLVRCACGAMMTPKSAVGRNGTYHYYVCTRQVHNGGRTACAAPAIPAEALEQAVIGRVTVLGSDEAARDQVVREALRCVDGEARRLESETEHARHRLSAVQAEIQNLLGALKLLGQEGVESVQEELARLEGERSELRRQLQRLAERQSPLTQAAEAARRFIETWEGVGELLRQAEPEEQRTLLQHYVEVIELRATDAEGKRGTYALRLFPEVRPLDPPKEPPGDVPPAGTTCPVRPRPSPQTGGAAVQLPDGGPAVNTFCQSDENAPRPGLEPGTNRLTAGCSTIELSGIVSAQRQGCPDCFSLLYIE